MSNKVYFGELRTGDPFEIELTDLIDPVTGVAFTTLTGVNFEFTVKESLSDLDAAAVANIKEDDSAFSVDGAAACSVRLVSNAISETLTPGRFYVFDGWLKDSNDVWRPINFGTTANPKYIGEFRVTQSVTRTKD